MRVLLKKILWYKYDENYSTAYNITNAVDFSTGNGLDIKNNILTITLKNNIAYYENVLDFGSMPIGTNVERGTNTYRIKFENAGGDTRDVIKLYLKYTTDASDLESSTWSPNSITEPDNDYLIGLYYITEFKASSGERNDNLQLVCADRTYILFNKILAKTFIKSENLTTPELIKKVVLFSSLAAKENDPNVFTIDGARYDINAKLVSEGGYIQDERSDASSFPVKSMTKVWKPVYEWVRDLSQIDYINTEGELSGDDTIVYGRPFIFWVDENQAFHWQETSDTTSGTLIVGSDDILNRSLTKAIFDTKNMIVFNAGKDMNDAGVLGYVLDTTSNVKGLKMQYIPMLTITKNYLRDDYDNYTGKANRDNGGEPFPQYPNSGLYSGGLETAWSADGLTDEDGTIGNATSDSTYNSTLRRAAEVRGRQRARAIVSGLAHARWKGNVELYGEKYTPGALIEFTDTRLGLIKQKLRIMDVKHSIGKSGWFTQLSLEEDQKAIIEANGL